jgi:hypothetical protein
MAFAVLAAVGTALLTVEHITRMGAPEPASESQTGACAGFLLLFASEVTVFLMGWYLQQPLPDRMAEAAPGYRRGRWPPLLVYLVGSVGIGLGVGLWTATNGLALMNIHSLRPLVYLLYAPTFFFELLARGILGRQFDERPIVAIANLLYFVAFFYPVYSLVVMDRVVEASRCRLMKTVLILFVTLHFLLTLFFALVMRQ